MFTFAGRKYSLDHQITFLFSYFCVKSKLDDLRGHKVVPVMFHKFDCLLLSSSQGMNILVQLQWNRKQVWDLLIKGIFTVVWSAFPACKDGNAGFTTVAVIACLINDELDIHV